MSEFKRICIECNKIDMLARPPRSDTCKPCANKIKGESQKDTTKTTCPKCNCKKSYKAIVCTKCKDQSGEKNHMYGKKLCDTHPLVLRNKAISDDPTLHPLYKDGSSIDAREGNKFQLWAKSIKELYDNKCDCCGYDREVALKAHHLYAYEKYANKGLELDNGVALCGNCHEEFHKFYGYGDNTKEQYIIFKGVYNG